MSFWNIVTEFNVIGLTIATIVGIVATNFFKSFVDDIFMPIFSTIFGGGNWEKWNIKIGHGVIKIGPFISAIIYFLLILALILGIIAAIKPIFIATMEERNKEEKALNSLNDRVGDIQKILQSRFPVRGL